MACGCRPKLRALGLDVEILLHQVHSIDALARPIRFAGRIDDETATRVREKLALVITL
ncbi:MAG: hypothetical protein QM651_18010 [Rhodoblastus sp.]